MTISEDRAEGIRMLRESAAAVVDRANLSRVRKLRYGATGFDRGVWRHMVEMGWLGLRLPETEGGSELGAAEACALAEELGAALAPEPLIGSAMAALLADTATRGRMLAGDVLVLPAWQEAPQDFGGEPATTFLDGKINGRKRFVAGAGGADMLIVTTGGGLALVDAKADGVVISITIAQDGTHWGDILFENAVASPMAGDFAAAFDEAALSTAAYLLGVIDRSIELTLEYLNTREQFGKRIGSFQALQHKCVEMKLQALLARASISSAAEIIDTPEATRRDRSLAVSKAKARASEAAMFVTRLAIQLHGGIGFTDEHDIGLYLRKAMTLAAAFGNANVHRQRYDALRALSGPAADTPPPPTAEAYTLENYNTISDDDFRALARGFLTRHHPPELRNPVKRLHWDEARPWYMILADHGWLAPGWPREYGGMGLSASKQLIYVEEFERFGAARTPDHGMMLLGPLLIRYGTEEQRRHYLPKILSGEHIWCQGYSEPNAGSDLASLRTQAVLDGDTWVINGQKTWTTLANDADWIFMLVRTDTTVRKQEGISFLLVPMKAEGVSIKPIINLDLQDEFCEVFFDNVRVPRDNLVGTENKGWAMAKALLGFERIFLGSPRQSAHAIGRLRRIAEHVGVWEDPVFRDAYVRLELDLEDHKALFESFAEKLRRGEQLGADVSFLKVHQSELFQRITDLMLAVGGEEASYLDPINGDRDLNPAAAFLNARASTIYGGASEVQRNIIAKNVLQLPD
ncbi:acyl-CoA dehydrogenase [Xanthobacteraceae bacterium A53D]